MSKRRSPSRQVTLIRWCGALVAAVVLGACNIYTDVEPPPSRTAEDTGVADTGGADTGGQDTGAGVDTGTTDTGAIDTGTADTGTSCACDIDGQCYESGQRNPDNTCQICNPGSPNAWSNVVNDQPCDDGDGLSCTGTCQSGTCTSDLRGGSCLIGGTCVSDGSDNPTNGCEVCDVARSATSWTAMSEGSTCDDGSATACPGICQSGTCVSQLPADRCLIDGVCYTDQDQNPSNDCEACEAATDQNAWTPVTNFNTCDGTPSCHCEQGVCVKNNGVACGA